MSEQIKKSDVSEKDIYGYVIESATIATKAIEEMNTQLRESAKLNKEVLSKSGKMSNASEIKATEQAIKLVNAQYTQKLKLENDLIRIEAQRLRATSQLTKAQEQANKQAQKEIQNQEKLTSTYSRVNGWLNKLTKEYRELAVKKALNLKLSQDEEKRMNTLSGRIKTYDNALKAVDFTTGKHIRNVGNYTNSYNGLGNSINQLTREMPAFANSVQTGFMAISNNLPIFFDEVSKIKNANKELIAQGQPVKSTFSQIASSVFSLGTLLSVGVTLLTVYGKQMVTFISNAFKAQGSVRSLAENQKTLNDAIKEGTKDGVREATQLDILYRTATNLNLSIEQRKKAVDKLQEQYPSYFANLKDEDILVGKAVTQYHRLRDAIFDSARAKAIQKKLEERGIERFDTELELLEKIKKAEAERNKLRKNGNDLIIKGSREEKTQDVIITNKELIEAQTRALKIYYGQLNTFKKNAIKEDELLLKAQFEYYKKAEDLEADRIKINDKGNVSSKKKRQKTEKLTKVIEYHVKALERLNEVQRVNFADIDHVDQLLFKRSKTEQEVYLLMAELTGNERLIREARITKIQADLKIELDSIEQRKKAYEEMRKLDPNLKADFETSDAYVTQLILKADLEITKIQNEGNKKRFENNQEYVRLATDYFIKQSERRIAQIDKEIEASQKQSDYLQELAKNGNIQAQQSLAEQQKITIEANQKKIQEQKRMERIRLAESVFDSYNKNLENNVQNPLLKTITDITALRAFINSLPAFEEGIDNTGANGRGLDGKGGFLSVLHPYERVVPKEENAKIGNLKNTELANIAHAYNTGKLVHISHKDHAGNSWDITPLLNEFKDLKKVIKEQPHHNLEVGKITSDILEFNHAITKGNTTNTNVYKIRKR